MSGRFLVLGGGGVAGIAWMTGLLLGLEQGGVILRDADQIIGTSAGATVAAQLRSRVGLDGLFAAQVDPALQVHELTPAPHLLALLGRAFAVLPALGDPVERTRRIGRLARDSETVDEPTRRAVIAARLPEHEWPDQPLTVVAVDTETGDAMCINRQSGIGLVDAVAASCAVPGLWPPVTLAGRRYMDGGIRSSDNADLAIGAERIVIVSPLGRSGPSMPGTSLHDQIATLEASGAVVTLIEPDGPSRDAIGMNPLAPDTRTPAAQAGLAQGRALAADPVMRGSLAAG